MDTGTHLHTQEHTCTHRYTLFHLIPVVVAVVVAAGFSLSLFSFSFFFVRLKN